MIEISEEHLLSLREASRRLPSARSGKSVHVSTLYRWTTRGVRGVRLETVRIGGTVFTSQEALQRFAAKLSSADEPNLRNTDSNERSAPTAAAEEQLRGLGLR